MKLLVENELNVIETSIDEEKSYFIEGVFATIGTRNKNGRLYPRHIWTQAVEEFQEKIEKNSIECLGEWEHPYKVEINPIKSVMRIVELKIKGDKVIGKAKILNNNANPTIGQIKALIDENLPLSISSRGVGDVNEQKEVTRFKLITFDLVSSPSDINANKLSGVRESLNENYDVVNGKIILINEEHDGLKKDCDMQKTATIRDAILSVINNF